MSLKALIFDVDGTLADTEEAHRKAFNHAFQLFDLGFSWNRRVYRKLLEVPGGKERIAAHLAALPLEAAERERLEALVPEIHAAKTARYAALVAQLRLRTGVLRLLDEAAQAGMQLAIASTTTRSNIDALLQATLGERAAALFEVIVCGDEVPHKKPARDVYMLALQRLDLRAEDAVAFEDSSQGLLAAQRAGLWTVATPCYWTEHHDLSAAQLVLPHLGAPELPVPNEPGGQLRDAAYLTCAELARRSQQRQSQRVAARREAP